MSHDIRSSKKALRLEIRRRLEALGAEEREKASQAVCAKVAEHEIWARARAVLFYAPIAFEIDDWPLVLRAFAEEKTVALPRFAADSDTYSACVVENVEGDLTSGRFGLREPVAGCPLLPLNKLDLIMVPGIGFDMKGRRLGRGKGYYDRLLANVSGIKCGLAFDQQISVEIPAESHDIILDCIVTQTRWLKAPAAARV